MSIEVCHTKHNIIYIIQLSAILIQPLFSGLWFLQTFDLYFDFDLI